MAAILLTVWKRNDKLKNLISALKKNRPPKIYVACDGPRENLFEEYKEVNEVKKSIDELIDWDCNVYKLYSEKNLGCRKAMTKAINWFFANEEEGIILEEDCIPATDFIPYCSELLEIYRENKKIWTISGTNLQDGFIRGDSSYYFSIHFNCWGWASWRDRWVNFDSNLDSWPIAREKKLLEGILKDPIEINFWTKIFDKLYKYQKPDSWAYRFHLTCFLNNALHIMPNKNLIKNIGFDSDATHTQLNLKNSSTQNEIMPLIHPKLIQRDVFADKYIFYNHYKMTIKKRIKVIFNMPLYYPKKVIKLTIILYKKIVK